MVSGLVFVSLSLLQDTSVSYRVFSCYKPWQNDSRFFVSSDVLEKVAHAFILSQSDQCIPVCSVPNEKAISSLQLTLNASAGLLTNSIWNLMSYLTPVLTSHSLGAPWASDWNQEFHVTGFRHKCLSVNPMLAKSRIYFHLEAFHTTLCSPICKYKTLKEGQNKLSLQILL